MQSKHWLCELQKRLTHVSENSDLEIRDRIGRWNSRNVSEEARAKKKPFNRSCFVFRDTFTPVAGLIFETKIESFFLESFFLERNYYPRTDFSGSNACSILSHPVISWNESRADPCPLGRIHYCPNVFSSLKRRNTPDFECFFLKKRPWKRFCTNVLIRGKWIHSTDIDGNRVLGQ